MLKHNFCKTQFNRLNQNKQAPPLFTSTTCNSGSTTDYPLPNCDTAKNQPLSYHHGGLSPIPLKPNSKKPAIKWGKYQDERPTEEQVKRWDFDNTGLLTGKAHNLLVVDLDSRKAVKWYYEQFNNLPPITPVVKTNRGIHIYYKYPKNLEISKLTPRKNVEILGDKHLICAPPSTHPDGSEYKWLNSLDTGLSNPPGWLLDTVKSTGAEPRTVNKNPKKHPSVSSQNNKSSKSLKNPQKVDTNTKTINDLLNHKVFSGKAKSGSCNGRYLSHLITSFRLGLDKDKAIQATKNKYPQLGISTIRDSARTVFQQGYGLSPNKMVDLGINKSQAESLFNKLKEITGGYCEVEHSKSYQTREQFNRNLFKASLLLTLAGIHHTTYKQFAELSGTSQSTLAHKDNKDLPQFVEIKSINGKGIIVYNYLPIFLGILAQLAQYLYLFKALDTTPLQNCYSSLVVSRGTSEVSNNNNISYPDSDSIDIRGSPN